MGKKKNKSMGSYIDTIQYGSSDNNAHKMESRVKSFTGEGLSGNDVSGSSNKRSWSDNEPSVKNGGDKKGSIDDNASGRTAQTFNYYGSRLFWLPCDHYLDYFYASKQAEVGNFTKIECFQCSKTYEVKILEDKDQDEITRYLSEVKNSFYNRQKTQKHIKNRDHQPVNTEKGFYEAHSGRNPRSEYQDKFSDHSKTDNKNYYKIDQKTDQNMDNATNSRYDTSAFEKYDEMYQQDKEKKQYGNADKKINAFDKYDEMYQQDKKKKQYGNADKKNSAFEKYDEMYQQDREKKQYGNAEKKIWAVEKYDEIYQQDKEKKQYGNADEKSSNNVEERSYIGSMNDNSLKGSKDQHTPVPAPRTNVPGSKSTLSSSSEEEKYGATSSDFFFGSKVSQKNIGKGRGRGHSDSPVSDVYVCFTCERILHRDVLSKHRDHQIGSQEDAILTWNVKKEKLQEEIEGKCDEIKKNQNILMTCFDMNSTILIKVLQEELTRTKDMATEGQNMLKALQESSSLDIMNIFQIVSSLEAEKKQAKAYFDSVDSISPYLLQSFLKASLGILLGTKRKITIQKETDLRPLYGALSVDRNHLLLAAFTNKAPQSSDLVLKYEQLLPFLERASSVVYLKINSPDGSSCVVYIKIRCDTFCGKQFRMLCSGETGLSYSNTGFHRECWKGKEGHHIWGGDYSQHDGSGGKALLDPQDQERLTLHPQPIVPGLVASRFGFKDTSTIFRIYIQSAEGVERFAFAQIVEGLEFLKQLSENGSLPRAEISESGVLL